MKQPNEQPFETSPLALVVIGGFLGAGKTTLINYLLANPEHRHIGVIVNDIGSINIDDNLIKNARQDRIALTNGCICCSLKSELVDAVSTLVNEARDLDTIVVEASGVSDPAALVRSIQILEAAGLVRTDTIVYIIDAESYSQLDFDEAEVVIDHAALSDLLIINKQDIASSEQLVDLDEQLDISAADAIRVPTSHCDIPLSLLFSPDINEFSARQKILAEPNNRSTHHDYQQCTLLSNELANREQFDMFVKSIASQCWRAKGFIRFSASPETIHLFNLVGQRATLEPLGHENEMETGIIVVGQTGKMNADSIRCEFEACFMLPENSSESN